MLKILIRYEEIGDASQNQRNMENSQILKLQLHDDDDDDDAIRFNFKNLTLSLFKIKI